MKAQIILSVDTEGHPILSFRHHDKSDEIEQKLLGLFTKRAIENGLTISRPSGYIECGTDNSWENYVIRAKEPKS